MPRILDHTTITNLDAKALFDFFESQSSLWIKFWQADTLYMFNDQVQFTFSFDVIQRERKEGKIENTN